MLMDLARLGESSESSESLERLNGQPGYLLTSSFQASLGTAEEVLGLVKQYKPPSKARGREAKL